MQKFGIQISVSHEKSVLVVTPLAQYGAKKAAHIARLAASCAVPTNGATPLATYAGVPLEKSA